MEYPDFGEKYSDEFLRKVKKRDEDSAKARELTPEQEADWKEKTSGMRDNLRDVARGKMENKAKNRHRLDNDQTGIESYQFIGNVFDSFLNLTLGPRPFLGAQPA